MYTSFIFTSSSGQQELLYFFGLGFRVFASDGKTRRSRLGRMRIPMLSK